MKTFQKIVTTGLVGLFLASLVACGGGTKETKTTAEEDRKMPPAAAGDVSPDDVNSGVGASFE